MLGIKPENGKIETTLHVKSTARYQYFNYTSPHDTKIFVIYSQSLKITGIYSQAEGMRKDTTKMRFCFIKEAVRKNAKNIRSWLYKI